MMHETVFAQMIGVSHRYRTDERLVDVVHDVNLTIGAGEIVGLVGASGAGKTTLGRLLLGLERPEFGRVVVDNHDLATLNTRALRLMRQRFHLLLQDPFSSLHPGLRIGSIIAEPLKIRGTPKADRTRATLAGLQRVGLHPADEYIRRYPHELSGGQLQRVAVARAFVARPRLVVADEPTSMLDASVRAGIMDLLRALRDDVGTAIVFITHDLASARGLCDRVVVLSGGRVVADQPPDDLINNPPNDLVAELVAASEFATPIAKSSGFNSRPIPHSSAPCLTPQQNPEHTQPEEVNP